jgi:hypothetical protein
LRQKLSTSRRATYDRRIIKQWKIEFSPEGANRSFGHCSIGGTCAASLLAERVRYFKSVLSYIEEMSVLSQQFVRTLLHCIAACLILFAASPRILNATAQTSTEDEFAKVVEDPKAGTAVLQLASRRFVRPGQAGPVVTTYSMLHFADRSFFEKRQDS